MNGSSERTVVGVWMPKDKWRKLRLDHFARFCLECGGGGGGVELVDVSSGSQVRPHVLLQKVSDSACEASGGIALDEKTMHEFREFIKMNPNCVVIDDVQACSLLRYETYLRCIERKPRDLPHNIIFSPVIPMQQARDVSSFLSKSNLKFPIICKPSNSHALSSSHSMHIVFNQSHLESLMKCTEPYTLQPYINHDAFLHKIYVLGYKVYVAGRPSIRNFHPGHFPDETISFHTYDVSKTDSSSSLTEGMVRSELGLSSVQEIASAVASCLGLTLFGVDVIVDRDTDVKHIIDINYFPGFSDVFSARGEDAVFKDLLDVCQKAAACSRAVLTKHFMYHDFDPKLFQVEFLPSIEAVK